MYRSHHLVFGFHGCDQTLVEKVIHGHSSLKQSENNYDWLGHGIYFWENDPERALDYAKFLAKNPLHSKRATITKPAVIGAVIDLGYCLNLLESRNLQILKEVHTVFVESSIENNYTLPTNSGLIQKSGDLLKRNLDCAIIETVHKLNDLNQNKSYDTVRGVFWEGEALYPGAGFKEKNHIQIAVRNPNSIKGYFLPRDLHPEFHIP